MHTLHFIAVEAEDYDDAKGYVQSILDDGEDKTFAWADYGSIGGWDDDDKERPVISYSEEPQRFLDALEWVKSTRIGVIKNLLDNCDIDDVISKVYAYDGDTDIDWSAYRLQHAINIASGNGKWDSHFHDIVTYVTELRDVYSRIETNSAKQFLVIVDFHH